MHALHLIQWINMSNGLSVEHIGQFYTLWEWLGRVHLQDGRADDIKWNLATNGTYSSAFAYKAHFEGTSNHHDKGGVGQLGAAQVQVFCVAGYQGKNLDC